ncbi:ABC transporter substrate-binding protein [Arcobacteraceae bacterium]|nr:ABC transporter substrate-binding protein [Arcobacteraceae bacterium]
MKRLALVIIGLCLLTQSLIADEKTILKQHFLSKIDEVILIVENNTIDRELRNSKIVQILTPMFDFTLMAKLSLGKKWRELNSIDQTNFVNLYVKRMKQSYSSKIDSYSNEKVEVTEINLFKKNRIQLTTNLLSKENKLEIVYKFYKPKQLKIDKDRWLIYDIVILGVSILKTDKAQFREFLRTKTIQQLMKEL